jgi:two-component system, LytTR family, response regulator
MTLLIIDDEAPARLLIRQYLSDYPNLQIIGECSNGLEAVQYITSLRPDLVFLDIQMPGLTGFEVIEQLTEIPQIIFSTAYDRYALQAFEVNALDFLLKPYTKERFQKAIRKALDGGDEMIQKLRALTESMQPTKTYPDRLLVEGVRKIIAVPVQDILWLEADGDYARLHTLQGSNLTNYGLGALAQKLDPALFIRVHRSAIVHLHAIAEVLKEDGIYTIVLTNGTQVRVGRSYQDTIRALIL